MKIPLTPDVIAQYKDFLVNPAKYKCDYKPLHDCFVEGDHYAPQNHLYEQYIDYIQKPLPKVIFYIIMQEEFSEYGGCDMITEKDGSRHNGDFGYKLKLAI